MTISNLLSDIRVVDSMRAAWRDSDSNNSRSRHEEGGFVVREATGMYRVERWPRGNQSRIVPPSMDRHGYYNGNKVVAAFHTHPNPPIDEDGRMWLQEPSQSDRRWHEEHRVPGFVICAAVVYQIEADGNVRVVGSRAEVL